MFVDLLNYTMLKKWLTWFLEPPNPFKQEQSEAMLEVIRSFKALNVKYATVITHYIDIYRILKDNPGLIDFDEQIEQLKQDRKDIVNGYKTLCELERNMIELFELDNESA